MEGPLGHYAKPLKDLLQYIKVFKKFSEGEKVAYLATVPEDMQDQVSKILETETAEEMKLKLEDALQRVLDLHKASQEPVAAPEKETKRGKRVDKQMEAWKSKIRDAAGKDLDFDKIISEDGKMDANEMDKSMMGIAAEVEPSLVQKKKKAEKFGFDPIRGDKVRIEKPKRDKTSK